MKPQVSFGFRMESEKQSRRLASKKGSGRLPNKMEDERTGL